MRKYFFDNVHILIYLQKRIFYKFYSIFSKWNKIWQKSVSRFYWSSKLYYFHIWFNRNICSTSWFQWFFCNFPNDVCLTVLVGHAMTAVTVTGRYCVNSEHGPFEMKKNLWLIFGIPYFFGVLWHVNYSGIRSKVVL